jgi:DHA1 family tetracycline resistance protein-like MFS transporter
MEKSGLPRVFYISLLIAALNNMADGVIHPLFSMIFLDKEIPLLPLVTPATIRTTYLGLFIALMPFMQLLTSPIWGACSDRWGRRKLLMLSLTITFVGYGMGLVGLTLNSLSLLFVSRALVGGALGGNMSILIQATIADLSREEQKVKNFGLYSMALAIGFMVGPFLTAFSSFWGYLLPFALACLINAVNVILVCLLFEETLTTTSAKVSWSKVFKTFKQPFTLKGLKTVFLCSFLQDFGWTYFFEFVPIFLMAQFAFSQKELGLFFGAYGAFLALSTGILIRPLVKRLKAKALFCGGLFFAGLAVWAFPFLPSSLAIWPLLLITSYFIGVVSPSATTIASNHVNTKTQGEVLGVLNAISAAGLLLSPLVCGACTKIGSTLRPTISIWTGGAILIVAALIAFFSFGRQMLSRRRLQVSPVTELENDPLQRRDPGRDSDADSGANRS